MIFGSPLEQRFVEALADVAEIHWFKAWIAEGRYWTAVNWADEEWTPLLISPQARLGRYRADFLLKVDSARLVVECDGHTYHERTPEQAAHDRQRDRYMQANGYTVFRFTGAEIREDASGCAAQCCEYLRERLLEAQMLAELGQLAPVRRLVLTTLGHLERA